MYYYEKRRNETGHPTGWKISRDEAEAYLLLAKEGVIFIGKPS